MYQTGTESLSVVSTDPCWFMYLSRSCLILLSVFWRSMQKWPWVWEKHYITKTTTSHLLSSSLLLCFSTFSFLLSCFSSSAALSLCLSPSSTSLCLWWQTSLISCMRRPCQSWRRTWRAVRMMMMMSPQSCDSLTSCQRSSPTSETPQRHTHSSPERQVTLTSCQRSSPTSETPQPWPHSPNLLTRGRVKFETLVTELTFNCSGFFQRSSDICKWLKKILALSFFYFCKIHFYALSSIVNQGVLNPVSVDHFVLCGFSSGHQWRKTLGLFTRVLLHQCHHRLALCHQTGQTVSVTIGPVI